MDSNTKGLLSLGGTIKAIDQDRAFWTCQMKWSGLALNHKTKRTTLHQIKKKHGYAAAISYIQQLNMILNKCSSEDPNHNTDLWWLNCTEENIEICFLTTRRHMSVDDFIELTKTKLKSVINSAKTTDNVPFLFYTDHIDKESYHGNTLPKNYCMMNAVNRVQ